MVRFGVFELDVRSGELRKAGVKIRLPQQPLQLLQILLEHRGEVVTREQLRQQLWGNDVYVDFDRSLNRAVVKLRDALGDLADSPRFIETLPRVGYRFIASADGIVDTPPATSSQVTTTPRVSRRWWPVAAILALFLLVLLFALWIRTLDSRPPRVLNAVGLSQSRQAKFPTVVSDGSRLYFGANFGGAVRAAQVSVRGGEVIPLATSPDNAVVFDISSDQSNLLVGKLVPYEGPPSLWILPVLGAAPHKVGDVHASGATWMPDRQHILYAKEDSLYVSDPEGGDNRLFLTASGIIANPVWSPDHSRVRFDVRGTGNSVTLWEANRDGSNAHVLLPAWNQPPNECCGRWSRDGRYYFFQSTRAGRTDLWALRDSSHTPNKPEPFRLTNGPLNMLAPFPSADGKKIYAIGQQQVGELVRYDLKSHEFAPYLNGISAEGVSFSRDGDWVTYVSYPEGTLWRSRPDGSDKLQLTEPPMVASVPVWSPDRSQIAFVGSTGADPVWQVYVISADGGSLQQLTFGREDQFSPWWFPDGSNRITYSRHTWANPSITVLDLKTKIESTLPDSQGMCCPSMSRDGRYLFAAGISPARLMMYDVAAQHWTPLWRGVFGYFDVSRDGSYLYFDSVWEDEPGVYRLRISDHKVEKVADLKDFARTRGPIGNWFDIAPDNSPLLLRNLSTEQLYELEVDLP